MTTSYGAENRLLRDRQAAIESSVDRSRSRPAGGAVRLLVQVYDGGSIPTAANHYFACHPVDMGGVETEGGQGQPYVNTATTVLVDVIGTQVPAVGDFLTAYAVGGRWVAERGGSCCGWFCNDTGPGSSVKGDPPAEVYVTFSTYGRFTLPRQSTPPPHGEVFFPLQHWSDCNNYWAQTTLNFSGSDSCSACTVPAMVVMLPGNLADIPAFALLFSVDGTTNEEICTNFETPPLVKIPCPSPLPLYPPRSDPHTPSLWSSPASFEGVIGCARPLSYSAEYYVCPVGSIPLPEFIAGGSDCFNFGGSIFPAYVLFGGTCASGHAGPVVNVTVSLAEPPLSSNGCGRCDCLGGWMCQTFGVGCCWSATVSVYDHEGGTLLASGTAAVSNPAVLAWKGPPGNYWVKTGGDNCGSTAASYNLSCGGTTGIYSGCLAAGQVLTATVVCNDQTFTTTGALTGSWDIGPDACCNAFDSGRNLYYEISCLGGVPQVSLTFDSSPSPCISPSSAPCNLGAIEYVCSPFYIAFDGPSCGCTGLDCIESVTFSV